MRNDDRPRNYRKDTLLTHLGRNPEAQNGAINPPVYHASTILSKNIAEWENRPDPRKAAIAPRSSARVSRRSPRRCRAVCRKATIS
jgi:cystathionine beta-lyase/cystathionine gamma-synthase